MVHVESIYNCKLIFSAETWILCQFWTCTSKSTYLLLICTKFLKNQFWKIKLGKLNFYPISDWIFTVVCKNQFRNWFCRLKIQFVALDFSNFKYRSRGVSWNWILMFENSLTALWLFMSTLHTVQAVVVSLWCTVQWRIFA